MCAMFRDKKPVDENRHNADTKPRGSVADAEFQRSTIWAIVGGTPRAWILR